MSENSNNVLIYPVFNQPLISFEHPEGESEYLGDAIGRDFMVIKFMNGFARRFEGDGLSNEDWFCYHADVLAPFDAVVERVHINPVENSPGAHTNTSAGSVTFLSEDGIHISYAHLKDIRV